MKVLWFSNTPSMAANYLNLPAIGGGWIESLEERIKDIENIDLAVAFNYGKKKLDKFTNGSTTYYAIPQKWGRIKRLIYRHFNLLDNNELIENCLEIINDFKPDIINIFGTESGFGLISDKTKTPVVIHLQGILTIYEKKWFSSKINKWDLLNHSSIKSLLLANSLIHNYYYFKKAACREQQIFKKCKYFMGRTDWDKRISAVLAPDAVYFNSNEILRREFYFNFWNKHTEKTKIIISTIQANIYKGLETVLECAILLKKINEFNFNWFVAGIPKDDIIVKIFEKKIGKKFKDFNIVLIGELEYKDLVKIEIKSDIFLHPSHIDNSPNSICEAMLLGMPVIATYTGGTGSLLTDKKEGILIQDGDPYSMTGAILELGKNPDYAAELGQNARKRAMKRHNPDEIVNNLINIYSEIISQNVSSPEIRPFKIKVS